MENNEYSIKTFVDTAKHGNGGELRLRAGNNTNSPIIKSIKNGEIIYIKTFKGDWLQAKHNKHKGYVMAKFIKDAESYVSINSKSLNYNRDMAVKYALKYSDNDRNSTQNYNKDFVTIQNKDCANFVSQCLYAGGMYMNKHWYFDRNKTPISTMAWRGTKSLKNILLKRDWADEVKDINQLKRGDIIYTTKLINNNKEYIHVTILVEDVEKSTKLLVCGHTSNQNRKEKIINNMLEYYHIKDVQKISEMDFRNKDIIIRV